MLCRINDAVIPRKAFLSSPGSRLFRAITAVILFSLFFTRIAFKVYSGADEIMDTGVL